MTFLLSSLAILMQESFGRSVCVCVVLVCVRGACVCVCVCVRSARARACVCVGRGIMKNMLNEVLLHAYIISSVHCAQGCILS